ncbi:MAG TPA: hypothetical protein VG055_17385 [Planctomycetaceae bacterium]|jgi:hypothetical protein|nr:hypothetical protein [Planctomycetaceae bacterium]
MKILAIDLGKTKSVACKRSSQATNVPTPLETRGANKEADVSARVIRWTSCPNDALGGVGLDVTSVLT